MEERWHELDAQLAQQRGFATVGQAHSAGFAPATTRRLVRGGSLQRPMHRVVAPAGVRATTLVDHIQLLQLSIKRPAFASHWTALWLWGLWPTRPGALWLTVCGHWSPTRPGVRVVSSRTVPEEDVVLHHGVLVTSVARTIVDVAGLVGLGRLRGIVLDALQRGLVTYAQLRAVAARRRGARGVANVMRICDDLDVEKPDSSLEHLIRRGLRDTDLPAPAPEPMLIRTHRGVRQIDVPWPVHLVGLDCDGLAYHASREAHDRDAVRRSEVNLTDWLVVFATWKRAELHFDRLVADLRRAFEVAARRKGWPSAG